MVCAGRPSARLHALAATNMAGRSRDKIGDLARFSSTAVVRAASLRKPSSVNRCVFLALLQRHTSFVRAAYANCAFPQGKRPDLGRCGSSERLRGVDSRSPVEVDPWEGGGA